MLKNNLQTASDEVKKASQHATELENQVRDLQNLVKQIILYVCFKNNFTSLRLKFYKIKKVYHRIMQWKLQHRTRTSSLLWMMLEI